MLIVHIHVLLPRHKRPRVAAAVRPFPGPSHATAGLARRKGGESPTTEQRTPCAGLPAAGCPCPLCSIRGLDHRCPALSRRPRTLHVLLLIQTGVGWGQVCEDLVGVLGVSELRPLHRCSVEHPQVVRARDSNSVRKSPPTPARAASAAGLRRWHQRCHAIRWVVAAAPATTGVGTHPIGIACWRARGREVGGRHRWWREVGGRHRWWCVHRWCCGRSVINRVEVGRNWR